MSIPAILRFAQSGRGGNFPVTILFFLSIFAVFYFLIIRPQKRKEKQRREMIREVRKGDRVVTIGGIHGEVVNAKEKTLIIEVDAETGATLKMNRGAIQRVVSEESAEKGEE